MSLSSPSDFQHTKELSARIKRLRYEVDMLRPNLPLLRRKLASAIAEWDKLPQSLRDAIELQITLFPSEEKK